jgi:tetratricopeptide (TPR) repeat protein
MKRTAGKAAFWLLLLAMAAPAMAADPTPAELLAAGRIDDVVRVLKAQTTSNPNDAEAYHLLCRAYYAEEHWDEAIRAGERAVALQPKNSNYHLWLGRAYGQKADKASWFSAMRLAGKTRSEFELAVELDGANIQARCDLSEYYVEAPGVVGGGADKARVQADQLAGKDAASSDWVKARLAEKDKNMAEAERLYKSAVEADHGDAERWLDLAGFYRRTHRYEEMEAAIQKAAAAPDRRGGARFEAASLLDRAGRNLPAAVQYLRQYLAASPPSEEAPVFQAHYLLGTILEKQGDAKGAAAEYREALALASAYQPAQVAFKRLGGS